PRDRLLPGDRRHREAPRPPGARARRVRGETGGRGHSGFTEVCARGASAAGLVALQGIDLDIGEREFVSLIGPSGCGKSTLLRILGDLIQPTRGDVVVNGKSPRQARLDRDYGIVFQDAVLFDWRTVSKNIALPLEMQGWDSQRRADRVRALLELVELTGVEGHRPWQLSGGMQQRVSIARALSFDPPLLLMDEPVGALAAIAPSRRNP